MVGREELRWSRLRDPDPSFEDLLAGIFAVPNLYTEEHGVAICAASGFGLQSGVMGKESSNAMLSDAVNSSEQFRAGSVGYFFEANAPERSVFVKDPFKLLPIKRSSRQKNHKSRPYKLQSRGR